MRLTRRLHSYPPAGLHSSQEAARRPQEATCFALCPERRGPPILPASKAGSVDPSWLPAGPDPQHRRGSATERRCPTADATTYVVPLSCKRGPPPPLPPSKRSYSRRKPSPHGKTFSESACRPLFPVCHKTTETVHILLSHGCVRVAGAVKHAPGSCCNRYTRELLVPPLRSNCARVAAAATRCLKNGRSRKG